MPMPNAPSIPAEIAKLSFEDALRELEEIVRTLEQGKGKLQLGSMVFHEQIAMAVAKGDKALLKALNAALFRMLNDGSYERLSMKYFGEDIRCKD